MTKVDIPLKNKVDASANFIQNEKDIEVQVRAPKRVLHFSDGTLEEFSDDEQDQVDGSGQDASVTDVDEVRKMRFTVSIFFIIDWNHSFASTTKKVMNHSNHQGCLFIFLCECSLSLFALEGSCVLCSNIDGVWNVTELYLGNQSCFITVYLFLLENQTFLVLIS